MSVGTLRDRVIARLVEDLVGPLQPDEVLSDRPSQQYSTGILYPRGSRIRPEEDEDRGLTVNQVEDAASAPEEAAVSLHAAWKPSVAGLSFAVEASEQETSPRVGLTISAAVYQRFWVDDEGQEVPDAPRHRRNERWRRMALEATLSKNLKPGESREELGKYGMDDVELYILVTPHAGVMTVTAALSNCRNRGHSSAFDEGQHLFQVNLTVSNVSHGCFAPRPSRRVQTDDDSRTAALIYRHAKEFVVGHTSSARTVLNGDTVEALTTDWVPLVKVPSVSDRGDPVFDKLREHGDRHPLDAGWLGAARPQELHRGLDEVVVAYRRWIGQEENRISQLPSDLQPQARVHIDRCKRGADRMDEGIASIQARENVRVAFQLSQQAMEIQFGWFHDGDPLEWRPFQLAFQLLVLASLSDQSHEDRNTMDLLWFPTGGGKTEAYLALTAFAIFLRRLNGHWGDDGSGVSVLMRYTLRLLTIQQFQRAAAMIFACELLRRRSQDGPPDISTLGNTSIGIGLWVGAAATPLTLRDALNLPGDDTSTPRQLTTCPCCKSRLDWQLSPVRSVVKCTAEASHCVLYAMGSLPVWTIDEEIYRHTPSLLIGTVDKFAQIVRKPETGALFGRETGHAPPDLIIQDELHLISGPLGSVVGLYEVAIDELCRHDQYRPKVIGSTATIRRAEDQIRSLFDRRAYQFPSAGLDSGNSGFAVTDPEHPGRLYVGITTAGRSATYMLQSLVASLLQAATEPDAREEERNYYWTLVTYFNSLRELGRALVLMQDDVPISVGQLANRRREQARHVEPPAELTSRVPSYEIRDMLERLSKPAGDPEAVDLLVASNMISVGMDIPRLGLMIVNAQPKTLSEYIQATGRVGRGRTPGLVVTAYNAMRPRDRSHYETFETWHRCLYRDVEATSVTPFSSRAQDKALHAVLVALVRHMVPGMKQRPVLDEIHRGGAEQIAALIESRVARIDSQERTIVAQKLRRLIDEWAGRADVETYWDDYNRRTSLLMSAEQFAAITSADPDYDPEGLGQALWPTPNSMREVEPGAPFVLRSILKSEGS